MLDWGSMNRGKFFFILFLSLTTAFPVWADDGPLPPLPQGPLLLTSDRPEQLNPEYWIQKLPNANKVLKTPADIKALNQDIHAMIKDCVQVFKIGANKKGSAVKDFIALQYKAVRGRGLYDLQNNVVPPGYFDANVKDNLNLEAIPGTIHVRWGVASYPVRVRALPTDIKLMEKKDDPEFDMLQFTRLKLWDPVAVYHTSKDGKWVYIQSPYTRGWAEASGISIFSSRENIQKRLSKHLVVLAESVPVFKDPELTRPWVRASMGSILAFEGKHGGVYTVTRPVRGKNGGLILSKGYIPANADVSAEFLPFTQANIIRQAFKLLGARYGWAGMYFGRDCSGFIQDTYLPFGIDMPRGSMEQVFVGTQLGHFEYKADAGAKLEVLHGATPGVTLLRMPHHQMIYLGEENQQFYVIHCTWAERYSMTSDDKNRINQVVVSDLNLNGKSYIGSLFDRIISISEIS